MNGPICVQSAAGGAAYMAKDDQYFAGARRDYVDRLKVDSNARVLELGCGNGDTGALALADGKCGQYCGVEICERAAEMARGRLSEVVIGDVERISLPWPEHYFDAMIVSEVLEHLTDPWAVIKAINPLLKRGALVFASSPNISHYSVLRMLLQGRWSLDDKGIMDRTHLRWFTPASYREMFEQAGFAVDEIGPVCPASPRVRLVNALTFGRLGHLFVRQVSLVGHKI